MQLLIIAATALLHLGSLQTKGQDFTVSTAAVNAFQTSFKNASDVHWKDGGHYYKADFIFNEQYVAAFYDPNGNLLAVTKNISPLQLPITLQNNLKSKYEEYWISDLFEVSNESGTKYYVTVENSEDKIILKSYGNTWVTYKKQRKS